MNNHTIPDTRKKISLIKQRNRAKKGITKHKDIKQGHVNLIYCINMQLPSSLNGLELFFLIFEIKICYKLVSIIDLEK